MKDSGTSTPVSRTNSEKKSKKSSSSYSKSSMLELSKSPVSSSDRTAALKKRDKQLSSRLPRQEKIIDKIGPYVHVEGDAASPTFSNVVNSSLDAPLSSVVARSSLDDHNMQARAARGQFGPTSTLAASYDAKRPDETWVCVFCKRSSHHNGLGDLFGPYFVSPDAIRASDNSNSHMPSKYSASDKEMAAKFILGGGDTGGKKKKKWGKDSPNTSVVSSSGDQAEIWFHEDCICWMPEVTLIGNRLLGLEEAVSGATEVCCSRCKKSGATIKCLKPGCKECAHFPCAREGLWLVNQYNFEAYCPKHYPTV